MGVTWDQWADLATYVVAMFGGFLLDEIVRARIIEAQEKPHQGRGGKHAARRR